MLKGLLGLDAGYILLLLLLLLLLSLLLYFSEFRQYKQHLSQSAYFLYVYRSVTNKGWQDKKNLKFEITFA